MPRLNFKLFDFSKSTFAEISEIMFPDTVKDEKHEALMSVQRPAIESAYYGELFNAFLHKKGLVDEYNEFRSDYEDAGKYFHGSKMQVEYRNELEWLIDRYERLVYNIDKTKSYKLGDKIWYQHDDGEKHQAIVQSIITYDGSDHFVDIEFNGKLHNAISLEKISKRW